MTDSTASYPAIAERRLPLGIGWAQMGLDGWLVPQPTQAKPAPPKPHPGQMRLL